MTEKPSRNEDEYFVKREAEIVKAARARQLEEAAAAERATHLMRCPKDGYELSTQELHGVSVDTCHHCGGMWLDAGELEKIEEEASDRPGILSRVMGDALSTFRLRKGRAE